MDELESFIDETIRRAAEHGYVPTVFIKMRRDYGTVSAISRLVRTGDTQTGFTRLNELGLRDWTIEAAVLRFPDCFDRNDRASAAWRLDQATAGGEEHHG
ncbi:MAG TPA: hypothetical protein VHY79_06030 [Rhizomicrobium sp.]|jgi:hypothetical protein|nr:hypothetical protein [Rhizomicrobium sp.]